MKKMLSILAAVGLTATASTAVVACATTIKESKMTVKYNDADKTGATATGKAEIKLQENIYVNSDGTMFSDAEGTKEIKLGAVKKVKKSYKLTDTKSIFEDAEVTVKVKETITPNSGKITEEFKKGKKVNVEVTIKGLKASDFKKAKTVYVISLKDSTDATITEVKKDKDFLNVKIEKASKWTAADAQ